MYRLSRRKYNPADFDGRVCASCQLPITTRTDAPRKERGVRHHYDVNLKYTDPELYNRTCYTCNGFTVPMHDACHKRFHATGRIPTAEHRAKVSATNMGHLVTDEMRKKMSEARKGKATGRILTPEHKAKLLASHLGKKLSAETREKIRQAHLGKVASEEARVKMRLGQRKRRGLEVLCGNL